MSIDLDDEILQDFLVEAGEILELLSEQLVELEQSPEDNDLLNAVFRGFHTIKGGAGFLAINPMVDICHVCEDVFNLLRQGERRVSPPLMDAVLQGLDSVQIMFTEIQEASEPTPATPELLAQLKKYSVAGNDEPEVAAVSSEPAPAASVQAVTESSDEADEEFDALLNAMDSGAPVVSAAEPAASSSDDISEDEFEDLLDQIHGKGKHGGAPADVVPDTASIGCKC